MSALVAWQHDIHGNPRKGHPPYRMLEPLDVPDIMRKRLSDYKFIMKRIEEAARAKGAWTEENSAQAANHMFQFGEASIQVPDGGKARKSTLVENSVK